MESSIAQEIEQDVFQRFGIGADTYARHVERSSHFRLEGFLCLVHDAFAKGADVHVLHFVTFFTAAFQFHIGLDMLHQVFQGLYVLLYIATFDGIERWSNLLADVVDELALLLVVVIGDAEALLQLLDLTDVLQHDADKEQQSSRQGSCQDAEEGYNALLCADFAFLFSQSVLRCGVFILQRLQFLSGSYGLDGVLPIGVEAFEGAGERCVLAALGLCQHVLIALVHSLFVLAGRALLNQSLVALQALVVHAELLIIACLGHQEVFVYFCRLGLLGIVFQLFQLLLALFRLI